VLVVEDNDDTRKALKRLLEAALGVGVDTVGDGSQALDALKKRPYSLMITDLKMPRVSGMQLIEEVQKQRLPVTVIVTTGHGSIEGAVQAIQLGAYDFLVKPADPQHLCLVVQRALRERTLQDEVVSLREQLKDRHAFWNVFSKSPRMLEIFELISHVAQTSTTVLIEGETGTGKELIARAIHEASAALRGGSDGGRQLRRPAGNASGERVIRAREGGLHGRCQPAQGPLRAGQRRYPVPG